MIDTDKMRAALAATPLCQNNWTKREGNNPTMLCAISAMVSFAGVQPDLIDKMAKVLGGDQWFNQFAAPVLVAEYNLPGHVAARIPGVFDKQENEWRGVTEVLDLCEQYNMDELHTAAIAEDSARFPQHTCAQAPGLWSSEGTITFSSDFGAHYTDLATSWVTFGPGTMLTFEGVTPKPANATAVKYVDGAPTVKPYVGAIAEWYIGNAKPYEPLLLNAPLTLAGWEP